MKARLELLRASAVTNEEAILLYIWLVEVQTPPSNLLVYIAGSELDVPTKADPSAKWRLERVWAIERAVKLGIDPNKIRDAILQHMQLELPSMERLTLKSIKRTGLRLGVLQESDLPEIVVQKRKYIYD